MKNIHNSKILIFFQVHTYQNLSYTFYEMLIISWI